MAVLAARIANGVSSKTLTVILWPSGITEAIATALPMSYTSVVAGGCSFQLAGPVSCAAQHRVILAV